MAKDEIEVPPENYEGGAIITIFRVLTPNYIAQLANMELTESKESLTQMIKSHIE